MLILFRLIALALVLAGAAVAAADLAAGRGAFATSGGELWYGLHPGSLNLTQAGLQRHVLPELWDPVLLTVLLWPAALVLLVPGLLLMMATRR